MTTRSLNSVVALAFTFLSCFPACSQRTPAQRDTATKEVLHEVLGGSVESSEPPADVAKPDGKSSTVQPSIVKKEQGASDATKSEPDANGESEESLVTKDAAKQKSEPKVLPKISVDDPTKPWAVGVTFPRETWEVQYLGNNPVGYFYHRIDSIEGGSLLRHKAEGKLRVSIKGESLEQYVLVNVMERANGELVSLEGKLEIGDKKQSFSVKIGTENLTISGTENEQPFSTSIPWERRFRGPFAVEQSMFRNPMQPKEIRKLKYFDPLLRKLIDGRLEASDYIITPTLYDGVKDLLEVRNIGIVGESGSMALLWVDNRGEGFKSYVPENDIVSFRTQAIDAEVVASISELRNLEVLPVPLQGDAEKLLNPRLKTNAFVVEHNRENPHNILKDGSAHRIRSRDALAVNVTVYLGGRSSDEYQDSDETKKQDGLALVPSSFIPSDNERINERANAMVGADKSISRETATNFQKANACRREIQKRIGLRPFDKRIGLFTNILRTKQANCVEHALFLAAHCRALNIPTRIALGVKFNKLAESPCMVFHAWVEIQDGKKWIPMDSTDVPLQGASIDEGKASIDRIRLRVADFNCANPYVEILSVLKLLPGLKVNVLSQEVP